MAELAADILPPPTTRREVIAWAMYDWANSAYSTLSITVLVSYITADVLPGNAGTLAWGWGLGLTMLVAAVLSPIIGAIADAHASKRNWLGWTTAAGALASIGMFFAPPEQPYLVLTFFLIANLGFELSQGFYNAFLPEIASDENMGRVSAWGYGLGYVGGGLALLVVLMMFKFGTQVGLPDDIVYLKRLALLLMGVWWGVFSLPILLWVRDKHPPSREPLPLWKAARRALGEVKHTLTNIRRYRMLGIFLLGFLIFNDGVQTVITQASVFADKQLKMGVGELAQVILMIQFLAWPGAILVGWLADRIGQKAALNLCLAIWVVILIASFYVTTTTQFWYVAVAVALVLGGTQSVSRTVMGLMTPERHCAEFFGFFNLSGKATSMFGPIFFSSILAATGSPHWALVSLLVFFIVGWAIILPLNIARGQIEARQPAL